MPTDNLKKFQQAVNHMVNHPKWDEAIEELDTKQESRNDAKVDAKGYLKKKGVPIPNEMDVAFKEGSFSLRICGWGYCVTIEKQ